MRGFLVEGNPGVLVTPDLGVEIFFAKEEAIVEEGIDTEIGVDLSAGVKENFLHFYCLFIR